MWLACQIVGLETHQAIYLVDRLALCEIEEEHANWENGWTNVSSRTHRQIAWLECSGFYVLSGDASVGQGTLSAMLY